MYKPHTASQTRDPDIFASTSYVCLHLLYLQFILGVVRVSCPGIFTLYARPIVIIPLLLVDLRDLLRASLRSWEGSEG